MILTGNDDGYLAALDLLEAGVAVQALVDMRAGAADTALQRIVSSTVKCYFRSTVYEAQHDRAMQHLTGVDICQITAAGQVTKDSLHLECDVLAMSSGYMPVYQLLCQAGAKLSYADSRAQFSITGLPKVCKLQVRYMVYMRLRMS